MLRRAVLSAVVLLPLVSMGSTNILNKDGVKLNLGLKLQAQFFTNEKPTSTGDVDFQRGVMLRRTRIQLDGTYHSCKFKLEWKVDHVYAGKTPSMQAENAFAQCPIAGKSLGIKVGLYDMPFSRDLLTSDSNQLAVDRGLVSSVPSSVGLADNTYGITFYGAFQDSHFNYMVGLYDNRQFSGGVQDLPTIGGRIEYNFFSSHKVHNNAHFGKDRWLSVGLNAATGIDNGTTDPIGPAGLPKAIGVDAMVDMPVGANRIFASAEFNRIAMGLGPSEFDSVGMFQVGFLIHDKVEPFFRFDRLRRRAGGVITTLSTPDAGIDIYFNKHNLKLQTDIAKVFPTTGAAIDQFRMQLQLAI